MGGDGKERGREKDGNKKKDKTWRVFERETQYPEIAYDVLGVQFRIVCIFEVEQQTEERG